MYEQVERSSYGVEVRLAIANATSTMEYGRCAYLPFTTQVGPAAGYHPLYGARTPRFEDDEEDTVVDFDEDDDFDDIDDDDFDDESFDDFDDDDYGDDDLDEEDEDEY